MFWETLQGVGGCSLGKNFSIKMSDGYMCWYSVVKEGPGVGSDSTGVWFKFKLT